MNPRADRRAAGGHAAAPATALAAAPWRLNLLGGFELRAAGGQALQVAGRTAQALLARLALPPQRAYGREELVELLWPGVGAEVGRNRLRQLLSVLRGSLHDGGAAGLLKADRQTVQMAPGLLDSDVAHLQRLAGRVPADTLRAHYGGELLPGFYDEWVLDERRRLAALVEPQPAWPTPARQDTVPRYLTRWLGAEDLAGRLLQALGESRLVVLIGPGGCGKTRLAVEAAQRAAQEGGFERVDFVALVACGSRSAMLDAMLLALHLQPRGRDAVPTLCDALAGRRHLLVLDNFEQLPADAAATLAALAGQLPDVHWLVTSRRVLGLDGERRLEVPPLPLPSAHEPLAGLARNPAVALFVDRARATHDGFWLSGDNAPDVVALVRELDGLPLAIELAASRVRSLSPARILALLRSRDQAPALSLLARTGPRAGHDARQASMWHVVGWSWALLTPPAQAVLAALSVFDGGCSLEAAQAVCEQPDIALQLDALVAESMLCADAADGRYALLEVIREFAAAQLDARARRELRARHRRWMIRWAQALPASPALPAVRRELRNAATAVAGAEADAVPQEGAEIFDALQPALGETALPPGMLAAVERCVERLPPTPARAARQATLARAWLRAGDREGAQRQAQAALATLPALPEASVERAVVVSRIAHIQWRLQRQAGLAPDLQAALRVARAHALPALQASILSTQGAIARQRDPELAQALHRQAIAAWQAAGDSQGVSTGRHNLALALAERQHTRAQALAELDRLLRDARRAEDWAQVGYACNARGEVLCAMRRWHDAGAAYRDGIRVAHVCLEPLVLAYCLWNLPRALAHLRQAVPAVQLMGFARRHWVERFGALSPRDERELLRLQRLGGALLGPAERHRRLQEGHALTLAQAVQLAQDAA